MIEIRKKVFKLDTQNTSYIFTLSSQGHPIHIYYGSRLPRADVEALGIKNNITLGSTVDYAPGYNLDSQLLEYSGIGKGDYRHSPMECVLPDGSFTTDFVYEGHRVTEGSFESDCGLPFATDGAETLTLWFRDTKYRSLRLFLHYTVFPECDVICRNAELHNGGEEPVSIRKLMSVMMDLPESDYTLLTLNGSWAKEAHIQDAPISYGIHVNDSTVGASSISAQSMPSFFIRKEREAAALRSPSASP